LVWMRCKYFCKVASGLVDNLQHQKHGRVQTEQLSGDQERLIYALWVTCQLITPASCTNKRAGTGMCCEPLRTDGISDKSRPARGTAPLTHLLMTSPMLAARSASRHSRWAHMLPSENRAILTGEPPSAADAVDPAHHGPFMAEMTYVIDDHACF
jgi:hypothetical protein